MARRRHTQEPSAEQVLAHLRSIVDLDEGDSVEETYAEHNLRARRLEDGHVELEIESATELGAFVEFDQREFARRFFDIISEERRLSGGKKTVYRGRL